MVPTTWDKFAADQLHLGIVLHQIVPACLSALIKFNLPLQFASLQGFVFNRVCYHLLNFSSKLLLLFESGVWERLWEKASEIIWNASKDMAFNALKVWKLGFVTFVKRKKVWNQIKIWTLTSLLNTKCYAMVIPSLASCKAVFDIGTVGNFFFNGLRCSYLVAVTGSMWHLDKGRAGKLFSKFKILPHIYI